MKKLKILSVVRSMGPGNAIAPILEGLRKVGHEVRLFAEAAGQAKDKLKVPFELLHDRKQLVDVFENFRPNVVISGLSWPRVLESAADEEANKKGIPIVHVEDFWGSHTRAIVKPHLIISINEKAKNVIKKRYSDVPVVLAGFSGILSVNPSQSVIEQMEKIRKEKDGKIIVLPDCGPESVEILPIVRDSVLMSKTPISLILKPKPYDGPLPMDGRSWDEVYEEVLQPLIKTNQIYRIEGSTDEVVALADGVASGFSALLVRAASSGKVAITVWTPYVQELLKKETGLEKTPLMLEETFPVISKPQPLDQLVLSYPPKLDLMPFDPQIAAQAILEMF